MQTFATTRNAKEFLVGRIVAEAEREGVHVVGDGEEDVVLLRNGVDFAGHHGGQ